MRKTICVLGLAIACALQVGLAGGAQAAGREELIGTWTSIDTDGSQQWLSIQGGGSGRYAMSLYDEAASSACGGAPAQISGSGRAFGDDLSLTGALTCLPGGNVFRTRLTVDFHFDTGSGELTDSFGVVWHRS